MTVSATAGSETHDTQSLCPLCGERNECAVRLGQPVETCWCASAKISTTVLDKIPAEDVGRRCICPRCASQQE